MSGRRPLGLASEAAGTGGRAELRQRLPCAREGLTPSVRLDTPKTGAGSDCLEHG